MTLLRKEYLYQLCDLSGDSHTVEYLATIIEDVIVNIEKRQISAVVSNNVTNVKTA